MLRARKEASLISGSTLLPQIRADRAFWHTCSGKTHPEYCSVARDISVRRERQLRLVAPNGATKLGGVISDGHRGRHRDAWETASS